LSARLSDVARFGLMVFDNDPGWVSISKKHRDFLKTNTVLFSPLRQRKYGEAL
jgi:hypothetical protein